MLINQCLMRLYKNKFQIDFTDFSYFDFVKTCL